MDASDDKPIKRENGLSLNKLIQEHLTVLDLSNMNIKTICENVKLPINLTELNLSNNKLCEVPLSVLNLENLKVLDVSHNNIKYFDSTPYSYQNIEFLNISNNDLHGPPYWIWSETPKNLSKINLSCNINITQSLTKEYFEELLEYKCLVTNIIIFNCKLKHHIMLLSAFPNAKSLILGTTDLSIYSLNAIEEVPCNGIDKCCDVEYLNLSNTNIYYVNSNIHTYKNLKEINLSHNKLDQLPEEFCLLEYLEICILSYNRLFTLPEKFCNLTRLTNVSVNSNELYTVPNNICKLPHIKRLDLYDNYLHEVPEAFENILEVDLARNYFEEPTDEDYLKKKQIIRANSDNRFDGRKLEQESESEHSRDVTDDETLLSSDSDIQEIQNRSLSSPEDWDSDEYWIPYLSPHTVATQSPWLFYVKQKINEGNFCPMDAHPVSIAEQVKYEKLCNPKIEYDSDGQFDDFSGDDS